MLLGQYIRDLEVACTERERVLASAKAKLALAGFTLYQTAHFIQRFDQRSGSPIESVRAFESSLRELCARVTEIAGKKIAVKVEKYVFIYDALRAGQVTAVSFWRTELNAHEALAGRGDILIEG